MSFVAKKCTNVYLGGISDTNWKSMVKSVFCQEHIFDSDACIRFFDPDDWNSIVTKTKTPLDAVKLGKSAIDQCEISIFLINSNNKHYAEHLIAINFAVSQQKTTYICCENNKDVDLFKNKFSFNHDLHLILANEFESYLHSLAKMI